MPVLAPVATMKYHSLINNRNLFLTVLETGKSKIKVLVDSVPGENPFAGS